MQEKRGKLQVNVNCALYGRHLPATANPFEWMNGKIQNSKINTGIQIQRRVISIKSRVSIVIASCVLIDLSSAARYANELERYVNELDVRQLLCNDTSLRFTSLNSRLSPPRYPTTTEKRILICKSYANEVENWLISALNGAWPNDSIFNSECRTSPRPTADVIICKWAGGRYSSPPLGLPWLT